MSKPLFVQEGEIYYLQGDLTHAVLAPAWASVLQTVFEATTPKIILDVAKVAQADSAFLALLLAIYRITHKQERVLKIQALSKNMKALMQVQGIWPLFEEIVV